MKREAPLSLFAHRYFLASMTAKMTSFDTSDSQNRPFNRYFYFTLGLVIITGCLLVYSTLLVDEEFQEISHQQDQFIASVHRYIRYQNFRCESHTYRNDNLLRKINNTTQPLAETYVPETLVQVPNPYLHPRVGRQAVRSDVFEPLLAMLGHARADGLDVRVNSAYRSFPRQAAVYEHNTVESFVTVPERAARPGYSEHQLGTAVDISLYPTNGQVGYDWLRQNAYRYGFVLSYPDGAQEVTEFVFEPWHWRYVGQVIAQHIHEKQMLFNHEKALFLPSPLEEGVELPYEYRGRDVWVWKSFGFQRGLEELVVGWQPLDFRGDFVPLLQQFKDGFLQVVAGNLAMPERQWMVTHHSGTHTDRQGRSWLRTSLASTRGEDEIERLEVLYREDFGYLLISYQTQEAGDRLVREFTSTCDVP